ncbi:Reelin domain-containing protein [Caenorhabditis elegans]|uniref:Reelin domain-containing protein n=1 Tax=Caenorhabditis elegans TaxID=6239 RepID=H2KYX9_CAEEL|nr:Reelin domain-containing protein [Caenorhabditis elegans]CCD65346.1 Reelin domain-containing protein [Caenorhabditis elegans]|eukprot:NP_500163.1 Uncharacterized protein CELE_C23H5.8 [Caenorhabditis elegans]
MANFAYLRLYLTIILSFAVQTSGNIGKCVLSSAPPSWLSTNGTGILEYATAGHPTNGTSFCIEGNHDQKTAHVAYHIDLGSEVLAPESVEHSFSENLGSQNGCVNNNTGVVYCFAICLNETLQNMVIESALKSNQPSVVAQDIQKTTQLDWAITVLQVDYNDPNTHLNASVFLVEDAWCSVYVGIRPKLGFDWLYEIQLGKVL